MKNLILICLMLTGVTVYAQRMSESKVPVVVKEAFNKKYAGTNAKWELEKGNYEANFKHDNQTMSALFDNKGTWLETETNIKIDQLPANTIDFDAHAS